MKIYSSKHQAIVEAPILQEPDILNEKYDDVFTDHFANDTDAYNKWLSTHTHATPELQRLLKDGQEVKEGIDYRLDYPPPYMPETEEEAIEAANEERRELTQYPKQVAIPIKQVSEEEPSPQQEEWAQRIKDEMEQAVKRNGADYANGYCEGLEDMRYELQSQLSQALAKINAIEKEVKTWVTNWNQLDKLYREALQTLEDNKRELQQTIKDQEAEIEALKQLK
jgi:chromosome segregation ATPase